MVLVVEKKLQSRELPVIRTHRFFADVAAKLKLEGGNLNTTTCMATNDREGVLR